MASTLGEVTEIDRTFIDGIVRDADDAAIVQSILALAGTLHLDVVAEGIEDAEQVSELVRLGCTGGQGFHLAIPAPPEVLTKLLTVAPG